ncbi:carbonyl reductase [NADPH] 3-like [Dreissena polymorpha]|uniref:carbonyl reductase (NADPH) n=1 Tax=Dreissena polymorpha TaxID=45954 RepID=A0A9D4EHC1_DREPO|nr:carbonyl reductase [NADPH] 3-like [Dreissena polymorpha]KAH3779338.1 hypothetical protein DPMN_157140 [Dreissena polymorpha]
MSGSKRVAVVTGSNKGIGVAIVRGLCKQFKGDVILTARNEGNGKEAIKKLNAEGLKPVFHQLDITDVASVQRLRDFLQKNYGGLDVLVNNAAIAYKNAATEPFSEQAEVTMATNFWGTLNACNVLFPILRPHARVVNISSRGGSRAASNCSQELQKRFLDTDLSVAKIEQLMKDFVASAKAGNVKAKGWPEHAYGISKIGVTLMTIVQQRQLNSDKRSDIVVNSCCPGYVATDLSSFNGEKTTDEGADTTLYLALLPPNAASPKGAFVCERNITKFL